MGFICEWSPKENVEEECCIKSVEDGKKKCCKPKPKDGQLVDSGMSEILLGVVKDKDKLTRHESRFGITSFVYRSRRPFHPGRLHDSFLEPFFMLRYQEGEEAVEEEKRDKQLHLDKLQKQAKAKQKGRVELMGELLRSKGFVWIAREADAIDNYFPR